MEEVHSILAWLYWDPNRIAFTLPVIDRPVAWYGLFFVTGFIIGYFMMIRIFIRSLRHSQYLAERDIISWPVLIQSLKEEKKLLETFPSDLRAEIEKSSASPTISKELKNQILDAINYSLSRPDTALTRENIGASFPNAISTLNDLAVYLTDRLTWFVIAGTIIGARLGHVFFYDWPLYREHPEEIVKIWQGGLASHGGVIGILIALFFYVRYIRSSFPEFTFLSITDRLVIPSALAVVFIRIGNFFNQEILGTPTEKPWGIIFGHPADGSRPTPRHPVQLYEALAYLAMFFILLAFWQKKGDRLKKGFLTGLCFVLAFSARFILEFFKETQGMLFDETSIQTGQLLSLPFILLGLWLMFRRSKNSY